MLVIGGRSSTWGPLVGAIVLTPLPELFRGAVQTQHIFYGAALIIILRFLPGGLAAIPGIIGKISQKRSEEHTSELQSLMRISYAVFCLKKKRTPQQQTTKTRKGQSKNKHTTTKHNN